MRAITVIPGSPNTVALQELPEPPVSEGDVLVETLAVGVCGTDVEIIRGDYGWPPPGEKQLVLGHEALGRVVESPPNCPLQPGDLVAPMVRHPDPVPCPNCAVGEWDMCRNGRYTEHGIKELHGFARERFRTTSDRLVQIAPHLGKLGVLLEPASILAKAWEHIGIIGRRAHWQPVSVLITGAGPIGLLAALMGRQRGLDVDVIDIVETGPKPKLVRDIGGRYHTGDVRQIKHAPSIAIECTGVPQLVFDVMHVTSIGGIVCLTGVSSGGREIAVDFGVLNRAMVLENDVVFGSVNANRRHYLAAAQSLSQANPDWLARLITRRVSLSDWPKAYTKEPADVKVILDFKD